MLGRVRLDRVGASLDPPLVRLVAAGDPTGNNGAPPIPLYDRYAFVSGSNADTPLLLVHVVLGQGQLAGRACAGAVARAIATGAESGVHQVNAARTHEDRHACRHAGPVTNACREIGRCKMNAWLRRPRRRPPPGGLIRAVLSRAQPRCASATRTVLAYRPSGLAPGLDASLEGGRGCRAVHCQKFWR